jgi:hypothetical protein
MKPKQIHCDEAGFTGANLLDPKQPYFTFASTDIEEGVARELVARAIDMFSLQSFQKANGELKGAELAKETNGREALEWMFDKCRENFLVSIHDKLFAIAGKFFDLTFEPIVSSQTIPVQSKFPPVCCHSYLSRFENQKSDDAGSGQRLSHNFSTQKQIRWHCP